MHRVYDVLHVRKQDNPNNRGNKMSIEQIVRWYVNETPEQFGVDAYGKKPEDFGTDGYLAEKWSRMQRNFVEWMATLDPRNRERLENKIREIK